MSDFLDVVVQLFVEGVARQGGGVAQDEKFHAGARHGHVHAAQVAQEANLPRIVGTHQRNEDDIAFLALEPIDRVDGNQVAEGFEKGAFFDQALEVLHLCAVG